MLYVIEGYPGAGKTYIGNQIKGIVGQAHVIDADDYTQKLLLAGTFNDCTDFYKGVIVKARKALAKKIRSIPKSDVVVLGGVIMMMLDETCKYQVAACPDCGDVKHGVQRIWLDITPPPGTGTELDESVKRAVIRELKLPATDWDYDPASTDAWERQPPPTRPLTDAEFATLFAMPPNTFRTIYQPYFDAMAASFTDDNISDKQKARAVADGYVPMTPGQILTSFASAGLPRTTQPRRRSTKSKAKKP